MTTAVNAYPDAVGTSERPIKIPGGKDEIATAHELKRGA
jgi:hypothetical protein